MPPQVATLVFALGIAALFALDREPTVRTSKALWLPVFWFWIIGSRSISEWMGSSSYNVTAAQIAEGSPVDAAVFALLLVGAVVVLVSRKGRTVACLRSSWPIVLYFGYCLFSLCWSDFPSVGFKRWTKAIGDLAMVLIIATDPKPTMALRRFFNRTAFILLPASILLIRYYGALGRAFDAWGALSITGVTTNKNTLGVVNLVLSLGAVWRLISLWRDKDQSHRLRHFLAQATVLGVGLSLFVMAHSATSGASFGLGVSLMLATRLPAIGRRPSAVHKLVLAVVLIGAVTLLFGGGEEIVHAMGRKTDFTGRTGIWEKVIPMNPNILFGAGYESFWLGKRLEEMWRAFPVFQPNEAHNGYIEVYIELGAVGLGIIALVILHGYWCAVKTFRRDPGIGSLMLAYVVVSVIYSITEAGFRMLDPIWMFLILAVVTAGRIASIGGGSPRPVGTVSRAASGRALPSEPEPALISIPAQGTN